MNQLNDVLDTSVLLRLLRGHGGAKSYHRLVAKFSGNLEEAALCLSKKIWKERPDDHLRNIRKNVECELESLSEEGINIITHRSVEYPTLLRHICGDSPPILYYKGDINIIHGPCVAMVGTRTASAAGKKIAHDLSCAIGRGGYKTVSGLAIGIDTSVHRASLFEKCKTIGVLGSGIKNIYPYQSKDLCSNIVDSGGLILSEFDPNEEPKHYNFPCRNRIISGLSIAVIVVEAGLRSGTMITVGHALSQGREVFAVPGSILDRNSDGTNFLLKTGARIITSVESLLSDLDGLRTNIENVSSGFLHQADMFEEYSELKEKEEDDLSNDLSDEKLLALISYAPVSVDFLAWDLGVDVKKISEIIGRLELSELVVRTESGLFIRPVASISVSPVP